MNIIKNQIDDKIPNLKQNELNLLMQNLNFETLFLISDGQGDDDLNDRYFYVFKGKNTLEIAAKSVANYEYIYRISREFIN